MNILRSIARRLYWFPGATLNTASDENLGRFSQLLLEALPEGQLPAVLNVGGGNRPLPPAHVPQSVSAATHSLDIRHTAMSTMVGDALHLPVADGSYNGLISLAMLEHVPDSERAVAEMHRVLRPGAIVYCEVPFMQVFHAAPHDYRRFTAAGVAKLFEDFEPIEIGVCAGPSSAFSWVARRYLAGLLCGFSANRRARQAAEFFAAWLTFPIKYLDLLVAHRPMASEMASAFYYLGQKPD
ncbi:MAG: methyltransferase domain-containing protein [Chloroflexota bacterium]|nr:methyltransferase domain-containing protein [Chloroflexota bacterium]MDP6758580.1 methyltransferase domain-containing protein [Chloroflexota bacterium]